MLELATVEACRSLGFDRAILFRISDGRLIAQSTCYEADPEWAAEVLKVARATPVALDHRLLETEMVRRRTPLLVRDVQDERMYRAVVEASRVRSYVAAPLMPEGRVIGCIHADRYDRPEPVDEIDRDLLWAFAEGFGFALERTLLAQRMRAQRDQVREMLSATEQLVEDAHDQAIAGASEAVPPALRGLTAREAQILALMASGQTYEAIADRLVISKSTVKTHVKHVLRKLGASNRAEAVSLHARAAALSDGRR